MNRTLGFIIVGVTWCAHKARGGGKPVVVFLDVCVSAFLLLAMKVK
jgi:hypothetical protein